jgi:hypothetical protein
MSVALPLRKLFLGSILLPTSIRSLARVGCCRAVTSQACPAVAARINFERWATPATDEQIREVILNGKGKMAPVEPTNLKQEDVDAVIQYLRTR